MESRIPFDLQDLESLRRGAVALRDRDDLEASEYQSRRENAGTHADAPPAPVEVITGRARRTASAEH